MKESVDQSLATVELRKDVSAGGNSAHETRELAFPIRLAERMSLLPDYKMERINRLRQKKRREGIDLVDMSMGNPLDATSDHTVSKLTDAARDPRNHRYSVAAGILSLRNEIARYYESQYHVSLDANAEVICTIGSKEGFSHLCLALLGPGDLACVPSPAYPIHDYSVILAGAQPLYLPCEDETLLLEQFVHLCRRTPKPKVLFLNYPHNPTGTCVELAFYEELVRQAKRYEVIVVNDFAYGRITFDGFRAPSFLEARGAREVGVELGTLSKSHNMAGWRVGYALGNRRILSALQRIKGYYDYGLFQAVQIAAIIALRHGEEEVQQQVRLYEERRDLVVAALLRMGWPVRKPQGGMFIWVPIPAAAGMNSEELAMELLEQAQVVVSPGALFGPRGEGFIRIALVENSLRLRQAMRGMRRWWIAHCESTSVSKSPPDEPIFQQN